MQPPSKWVSYSHRNKTTQRFSPLWPQHPSTAPLLATHVSPRDVARVAVVTFDLLEGNQQELHLRHVPVQAELPGPLGTHAQVDGHVTVARGVVLLQPAQPASASPGGASAVRGCHAVLDALHHHCLPRRGVLSSSSFEA